MTYFISPTLSSCITMMMSAHDEVWFPLLWREKVFESVHVCEKNKWYVFHSGNFHVKVNLTGNWNLSCMVSKNKLKAISQILLTRPKHVEINNSDQSKRCNDIGWTMMNIIKKLCTCLIFPLKFSFRTQLNQFKTTFIAKYQNETINVP